MKMAWAALAIAGLLIAVGVSYAASQLASPNVGISSEPITAGAKLAPARTVEAKPAPRVKKKRPKPKPPTPTVATPEPSPSPPVAPPVTDDHGDDSGGHGGGDDSGGHGSDD